MGGATFMASALDTALDDLWMPYINSNTYEGHDPEDRLRITLFLTDGEPTQQGNQDPCVSPNHPEIKDAYDAQNITIIPIVMASSWGHGDHGQHVGCLQDTEYWGMYYIDPQAEN